MDFSTVKWMDLFLTAVNDCVPKIEIKSANSAPTTAFLNWPTLKTCDTLHRTGLFEATSKTLNICQCHQTSSLSFSQSLNRSLLLDCVRVFSAQLGLTYAR